MEKDRITKQEMPSYKFGSSARPGLARSKDPYPGPGHYRLRSTFADVPKYLIPN